MTEIDSFLKDKHILAVDDEWDVIETIQEILDEATIDIAQDYETASEKIFKTQYDLAILDIKLKKMSGVEVLEELKMITPSMGVIMLTGYPTMETARESLKLGATEYCVKPIDKDEIEEKVASVLGD